MMDMTKEEAEKKVHSIFLNYLPFGGDKEANEVIKALEQELCTLDDARDDFMFDVYNILNFLPTNNEANQIIDVFDRITSGLKQESILDKIKAEIKEKFEGCDICEWFEDYNYEENDISEYYSVGNIDEILDIIDKYKESEVG